MDFYDDIEIEKLLNVSKLHIGSWLATIERNYENKLSYNYI